MRYLIQLARILVGGLFIFSGFIKLNDPVGFSFKLEEYFSSGVLDIPLFEPYALQIAIIVVILEVLLGVMLLLGIWPKTTVWSLLAMIVFFTFLTWYSAYYNKVTDCGCFGDAIKLTPWESFTKDVILLVLILVLLMGIKYIKPIFDHKTNWALFSASLVACCVFCFYVLNHLPWLDFRPYHIGANIEEGMSIPPDAPKPISEFSWKFMENGEEKVYVTSGDYPNVNGEFIGVETELIQEGYEPPVHDFTIEKDGEDQTDKFLKAEKLVMIISYDLAKAELDAFTGIKEIAKNAREKGYEVIGMSASSPEQGLAIVKEYGLPFEFYFTDQTTLKTIVRSNPGILVLEKGTILQKAHFNDAKELNF